MDKYINIYNDTIEDDAYKTKIILEQHASIADIGEIVVSSKDKPIIGTTGLDTCFGIVLYDRKNKKGIVGHAYSSGKIAIMHSMLELLDKNEQQVIEYAIVSGYRNTERKDFSESIEIQNYLEMHCPQNIKLVPFQNLGVQVCSNALAYEFAFDVNTGQNVTSYLFYDRIKSAGKYY